MPLTEASTVRRWSMRSRAIQVRLGRWLTNATYTQKWLVLGTAIGIIAGLGAIVFYEALRLATYFFLQVLAGYKVPLPVVEGGRAASASFARPWAIPLIACVGALLGAIIVFRFAPEAEGLGTEILYRDDFEVEALLPSFIASIVGYSVWGSVEGFGPLFGYVGNYHLTSAMQLVWFGLIGIIGGLIGLLYAKSFYGISAFFSRMRLPRWLRPAL